MTPSTGPASDRGATVVTASPIVGKSGVTERFCQNRSGDQDAYSSR